MRTHRISVSLFRASVSVKNYPPFKVNWDSPLIMEPKLDGDALIMPEEWRDEDDDEDEASN